jgi:hypothetical protein
LLIEVASSSASSSLPLRTDAAATREPIAPADSCVPGSTHSPPGPAERRVGSWPGRTPSAGLGRPGRRQAFSASTDKVTFDNAEGAATLATLSELGRTGAFKAGDEIGSPGTIAPDTTARRVTYSGNAGTYTVDQAASITCVATDVPRGSGIASTTCADLAGGADSFGLGTHAFSATATDNAGTSLIGP